MCVSVCVCWSTVVTQADMVIRWTEWERSSIERKEADRYVERERRLPQRMSEAKQDW